MSQIIKIFLKHLNKISVMRLIIYLIILSAFNITALAQNQLVEILADSLFSSEVNDQSSDATGAPLEISVSSFGGQSFIIDSTGILTRIEVSAKKMLWFFNSSC